MTLQKELDLQKDFSPPSKEEWIATAEQSLKGRPLEKLVSQTDEGIDLQPIYTSIDLNNLPSIDQAPGISNFLRGSTSGGYHENPWEICQEIHSSNPQQFNDALMHDLKRGQDSIQILLDIATQKGLDSNQSETGEVGHGGLTISTLEDLSNSLSSIPLDQYPVHISAGFSGLKIVMLLNALAKKEKIEVHKIKGSIDIDPLGYLASHVQLPLSLAEAYDQMAMVTRWSIENSPNLKTIGVSGLPYHHAGADAVNELAFTLSTAVEYIDELAQRGLNIDNIVKSIRFTFGIGPQYFMEISKIRAARVLWGKILENWGVDKKSYQMTIHARTSGYNQTQYDPYVNMLRSTTETFAAIVSGVDSIHTSPFNEVFAMNDEFSRRQARNSQIVLREESRLDQLIDPAGGSYYVESLTHQVCNKAWKLFQDIEAKGGMLKALKDNIPQEAIASVHDKRQQSLTKRKSIMVGTNFSANVTEKKLQSSSVPQESIFQQREEFLAHHRKNQNQQVKTEINEKLKLLKTSLLSQKTDSVELGSEVFLASATLGEVTKALDKDQKETVSINPLRHCRSAEIFEELRNSVEIFKEKSGHGPKLFLANMGPLAQHKARADFSQGFFEIGGFEILQPELPAGQGFSSANEAVEGALKSNAPVVVICSTDETYPELVPAFTQGIKEKKPDIIVVVAGYPKDLIENFKQAGVDEFIFLGANVHQVLLGIFRKTGIME